MRMTIAILALVSLAACGPAAVGYPPGVEMNFMQACQSQGAESTLCACTWDRIEAEIEPNDFAALERLPGPEREAHPITGQIEQFAMACNASTAAAPVEPAPAP